MSGYDPNLQAVLRIKHMAGAAKNEEPSPFNADPLAAAYMRLRGEAKEMNREAFGGDDEKFDEELPPLPEERAGPGRIAGPPTGSAAKRAYARALEARVLLGQLEGWAAGHQETLEISARIKSELAKPRRGPSGFAP